MMEKQIEEYATKLDALFLLHDNKYYQFLAKIFVVEEVKLVAWPTR